MKKYIAPEVEIKRFAVESIMEGSEVTPVTPDLAIKVGDVANGSATVNYNDLFNL